MHLTKHGGHVAQFMAMLGLFTRGDISATLFAASPNMAILLAVFIAAQELAGGLQRLSRVTLCSVKSKTALVGLFVCHYLVRWLLLATISLRDAPQGLPQPS